RFYFSRRRRHTSWPRDWSSDVCSSDLILRASSHWGVEAENKICSLRRKQLGAMLCNPMMGAAKVTQTAGSRSCSLGADFLLGSRSEERRVGTDGGLVWEWVDEE